MYDAGAVFDAVDERVVLFLLLGAGALACTWYYFYQCARLAHRDRCSPMALWATTVFIGHDGSYLLNFDDWFGTYDHWFPQLFWFGLIVTFSFEVVFFSRPSVTDAETSRPASPNCSGSANASARSPWG